MEKEKIDLSIIILSHNSKSDLKRLLPSVFASRAEYSYEIIVVDNASTDGTADWVEQQIIKSANHQIRLIRNRNTGFAHGNNLGTRSSSGNYILLLNPDTELQPNTLQVMLEFMDNHQDVGISGCKVIKPDGSLDLACRRRFPNPWNSFKRLFLLSNQDYNYTDYDENQSMEVDSVMGAFMMIRRIGRITRLQSPSAPDDGGQGKSENQKSVRSDSSDLSDFPMLDEDFFMYGEDIDLCWRCKQAGFKVWYHPVTSIIHYKGSSSSKIPFKALRWFHDAMWIFYKKHYAHKYFFMFNWLVWFAIYMRMIILMFINLFRREKFVSK